MFVQNAEIIGKSKGLTHDCIFYSTVLLAVTEWPGWMCQCYLLQGGDLRPEVAGDRGDLQC